MARSKVTSTLLMALTLLLAASCKPTPPAVDQLYQLAKDGVTHNTDWTPHTEEINGVMMALVPAGCFQMGSEDGDSDERPVHEVCFEEPFWIDVYEVTQSQFAEFGGKAEQISYFTGEQLPRETITWIEADAFCRKRNLRLPTEAEWEYAARGPDGLVYPWGNEFETDSVIYNDTSSGHTSDVGSKPEGTSWVGAYDLSGNVWEWVNDWYGPYASDASVPDSGTSRVLRGGSWGSYDNYVRGAMRHKNEPDNRSGNRGFRCGGIVPDLLD
ncbi:MAG: formylglycine-generating enzyme family protein [Anaerolineae bacterium]|nr:formylglycine-generating enzyme family protein [Anaerolineae bacterium]